MTTYITLPKRAKDITGQRYGRLVALGPIGYRGKKLSWLCQCDCGQLTDVAGDSLHSGNTKSCGCWAKEYACTANRIHGMSNDLLYKIWISAIDRCGNPDQRAYANYGGRGIAVCDEWRHDFQAFRDHVSALPHFSEKGYSLDRVDNDGNYEPGNVRWATWTEQQRNTRLNRNISHDGRTQCLAAWAEEIGISTITLRGRLSSGWTIERALSTPARYYPSSRKAQ